MPDDSLPDNAPLEDVIAKHPNGIVEVQPVPPPDVLDGVFQRAGTVNGPGRVYGRPLMEKAMMLRFPTTTLPIPPPKDPVITTERAVMTPETAEVLVTEAERLLIEEACEHSPTLRRIVDIYKDDPAEMKKLAEAIMAGVVTKAKQDAEHQEKYGDVFQRLHYSPTGRRRGEPEFIVIGPPGHEDLRARLERLGHLGNVFAGKPVDFAGIEARVLAMQPELLTAMEGPDPHTTSAMEIYGVAAKDITPEMRREGKLRNFHNLFRGGASARISAGDVMPRIPVFEIRARDEAPPMWPGTVHPWDKYPSLGKDDYDEKLMARYLRTGEPIDPEIASRLERRRRDKVDEDKRRAKLAALPKDDAEARERCRAERAARLANPDRRPPVRVHFTKRERAEMKRKANKK